MRTRSRLGIVAALFIASGFCFPVEAASFCTCEDRDNDGRFGVVLNVDGNQSVIRPNEGTYYACQSLITTLGQCSQNAGVCTCEDRDNDGRFGIVSYPSSSLVLRANQGTYYACRDMIPSIGECNGSGSYCACEDRDEDGRFGIVLYKQARSGSVLAGNQGTYYDCTSFKTTLNQCGQSGNLCTCEDRDEDGRFGVVLYRAVNQANSTVLRGNVGTYYSCKSAQASEPQCP